MDGIDVVLETRVSARGSLRHVFQTSRLVSVSKSKSLSSARLAFRSQISRLELKIVICMCELADKHCGLCANC